MPDLIRVAASRDADVIAAIRGNDLRKDAGEKAMTEWAKVRGFPAARCLRDGLSVRVLGLPHAPRGFGDWTSSQTDREPSRPKRTTNLAEADIVDALSYCLDPVPGVPIGVRYGSQGQRVEIHAKTFVVNGIAYAGFGQMPNHYVDAGFGLQWKAMTDEDFQTASLSDFRARSASRRGE